MSDSESGESDSESDELENSDSESDEWANWSEEQPTLSEEMKAAKTRLKEAETLYLQELDRVCALSSPRVAFERRLAHLERTSQWKILDVDVDDKSTDDEFPYRVSSRFFDLKYDAKAIAFLSKDHGNVVVADDYERDKSSSSQDIYLRVLPDPASMTDDMLKKELKRRRLSDSGEKADWVARLKLKESVVELP
jgi:hypothetical protein